MKNKTRPSAYQPQLPFLAIRAGTLISAAIVGGILAYFIAELRGDGFRLPWTFLVMFAADILVIVTLLITSIIHSCAHLSPLLNMIVSIPLLLLWTVGLGLLIWNMYGTLGHSCTAANWGNSDGIMICHQYKTLFSFVVIGWVCQIALIVLDVRAKRNQNALGKYGKMQDPLDHKLDLLDHSRASSVSNIPYGAGLDAARDRQMQHSQQPASALNRVMSTASSFYSRATTQPQYQPTTTQYEAYRPNPQFDPAYTRGNDNYSIPPQQTHYDNSYGR